MCVVLFSAVVIQWITSKDNAASGSKPDDSHQTGDAATALPCFNNGATAGGTPGNSRPPSVPSLQSSSTCPVIEDIAEISLDSIKHRASSEGDAASSVGVTKYYTTYKQ